MAGMSDMMLFGIKNTTKDRLDLFKGKHKEDILKTLKKTKRLVTNDDVVQYLLYLVEKKGAK